ncbi:exonuclease domain-containing protein [Streptosporangium sp. CA-135522]|uniref:exonuclease domain-containing protein n=1 Tax=Streptosporangium sp. CA-135522 TaxID=3240072 RepID=UPI003D8E0BD9
MPGTGRPHGYAVIDVETTGLRPSWNDRMIEIGIVHLDLAGAVTGEWVTLINPGRDLGPQHIHGITAADIRHAPAFEEIAGAVAERLDGRVVAAHNLPFDVSFVSHEFGRMGLDTPLDRTAGVCTMAWSAEFLPGAPRSLAACCARAGIPLDDHHEALADARAAAGLLRHYLATAGQAAPWEPLFDTARDSAWPLLGDSGAAWVRRGVAAARDPHFLTRIAHRPPAPARPDSGTATAPDHGPGSVPDYGPGSALDSGPGSVSDSEPGSASGSGLGSRPGSEAATAYLTLLDQVLLDHHISVSEADALVRLAAVLELGRSEVERLHLDYLAALARAALADGLVTEDGRHELELVATLLGLSAESAERALSGAIAGSPPDFTRFSLTPGDLVVFTGEMDGPRDDWEWRALQAGYVPHGYITKKVRLLVAADPDSLSTKARKARDYGIPIVTPDAFARMLG